MQTRTCFTQPVNTGARSVSSDVGRAASLHKRGGSCVAPASYLLQTAGTPNFIPSSTLRPVSLELQHIQNMADITEAVRNLSLQDQAQSAPTTRSNLPLTQELKDQIYGYLLLSEHVKWEPYFTRDAKDRGKLEHTV